MRRQQTDVRRPSDSGANRAATPSSTRPSAASLTRPGTTVESTPSHPLGTNATKASGLPGVDKVSWGKLPWRARVLDGKYSNGATKYRTVGYFATADEAAQAHGREAPALLSANLPTVHEGVRLFLSTDRRNKSGYAGVRYIDDHGNGKYRYMAIGPSGVYLGIFGCRLAAARAYALHIGTPPVAVAQLAPSRPPAPRAATACLPSPAPARPTLAPPPVGFALCSLSSGGTVLSRAGSAAAEVLTVGAVVAVSRPDLQRGSWHMGVVASVPRSRRIGATVTLSPPHSHTHFVVNMRCSVALPCPTAAPPASGSVG
jgi:hypothetical protein